LKKESAKIKLKISVDNLAVDVRFLWRQVRTSVLEAKEYEAEEK
jgi:hypothetical protein